jgi:hypothetical protein
MLCPPLTPLNRRPNVPNLPDPHRARPPAQRVRSSAYPWRPVRVTDRAHLTSTCPAPNDRFGCAKRTARTVNFALGYTPVTASLLHSGSSQCKPVCVGSRTAPAPGSCIPVN